MGDAISSFLFQPPPASKLKESKIVWLKTNRGKRIPAFYIQCSQKRGGGADAHSRSPRDISSQGGGGSGITILYSHANAEDLGNIYPWCKFLSKSLRVNVFAYDYTGYGLATDQGDPSEEYCYSDIDAAYDYLRTTLQVPAKNIVLYGRSLGSGPSCYLASRTADEGKPLGGVILHAPFLSVFRVVIESGCTLPGDKFPNIDFVPFIKSPVMLIHGTKDQIVPFTHSEQLLSNIHPIFRSKPLLIEGMGHNNIHPMIRPLFVERISEFLTDHVTPQEGSRKAIESLDRLLTKGYVSSPSRRRLYTEQKLQQ